MPKSLDQVLKRVIGPMVKKVVQSKSEIPYEVSDEWEWNRLEGKAAVALGIPFQIPKLTILVMGQELNATLEEARQSILHHQESEFPNPSFSDAEQVWAVHSQLIVRQRGKAP